MKADTARKKRKPETERTLGWLTKEGDLIQINNMEDGHLLNSIRLTKLQTGVTSLSILSLRYLEAEANDRGLKHDLETQPF